METTFEYLYQWSQERLIRRYEMITPVIECLIKMFNCESKTILIESSFISNDDTVVLNEMLFSTLPGVGLGFPDKLETFIHDYCTVLCAEKLVLESLIKK